MKFKRLTSALLTGVLAFSLATPAFAYPASPEDEDLSWRFYDYYDGTWKSAAYIMEPDMPTPSDWAAEYVYVAIAHGLYYMQEYDKTTDTLGVNLKSWQAPMTRDDFVDTLHNVFTTSTQTYRFIDESNPIYQFRDKYTMKYEAYYNDLVDSEEAFDKYRANGGKLGYPDYICYVLSFDTSYPDYLRPPHFNDVDSVWVEKMADLGIVSGVGNGNFNPSGTITREQAATIMMRLLDKLGVTVEASESKYTDDNKISDYAKDAVYRISNIKDDTGAPVMQGTGNGAFDPQAPLTNEQCMVVAVRLYYYLTNYVNQYTNNVQ